MTPGELLARLRLEGYRLHVETWPDGERIAVAPALAPPWTELVRRHKAELLRELRELPPENGCFDARVGIDGGDSQWITYVLPRRSYRDALGVLREKHGDALLELRWHGRRART